MSSPAFRSLITATLAAQWTATPWFDLSDYTSIEEVLAQTGDETILLVQFGASMERLATIATDGFHGWREDGQFFFHLVAATGRPSSEVLALGEQLRAIFRGQRFGSFIIDGLDPFSDFGGAAIRVLGKGHGWSAPGSFYNVICNGP